MVPAYYIAFFGEVDKFLIGGNLQGTPEPESGRGHSDTQVNRRVKRATIDRAMCIENLNVEQNGSFALG